MPLEGDWTLVLELLDEMEASKLEPNEARLHLGPASRLRQQAVASIGKLQRLSIGFSAP